MCRCAYPLCWLILGAPQPCRSSPACHLPHCAPAPTPGENQEAEEPICRGEEEEEEHKQEILHAEGNGAPGATQRRAAMRATAHHIRSHHSIATARIWRLASRRHTNLPNALPSVPGPSSMLLACRPVARTLHVLRWSPRPAWNKMTLDMTSGLAHSVLLTCAVYGRQ